MNSSNTLRISFLSRLLCLCAVFHLFMVSHAFSQRKEDIIYLSNGSVIHGTILKDSTSQSIRILSRTGDIWAFDTGDVDSVKYEKTVEFRVTQFNRKGFDVGANVELLMRSGGTSIGKTTIPGLNMGAGYRFNHWLSAGTEAGIEFYEWMEMPLSVSLRVRAFRKAVSPLVLIRAGYTVPLEKRQNDWDYEYESFGGVHTSIGAGLERIINENTAFLLTIAYHYQELNYHLTPLHQWVQERDRKETYSRLRLSVGYVFK